MAWRFNTYSLIILGLSKTALAYPTPVDFNGKLARWDIDKNSEPILYEITSDDASVISTYSDVIAEAAQMWTEIPSSYFRYAEAHTNEVADVTIRIETGFSSATSSGYATFDEYDDDNNPVHCQIHVDGNLGTYSLGKTTLHELGHCLGLGHSLIPEAIMSYQLEKNTFGLDTDDMAALSRLYPESGGHPKLPPGCATGARPSGGALFLLLSISFLLILGRGKNPGPHAADLGET